MLNFRLSLQTQQRSQHVQTEQQNVRNPPVRVVLYRAIQAITVPNFLMTTQKTFGKGIFQDFQGVDVLPRASWANRLEESIKGSGGTEKGERLEETNTDFAD